MTDPFTDVADELMTRSTDLGSAEAPPPSFGGAKTKKHVCPYCGAVTAVVEKPTGPCPKCNMEDTPATRAATKARIGPWYVLQNRNPSAPGMKWATLLSLVSKGQVTPRSVVRGPTTHQLWKFAAHVKGLSREFNLCYSCGGEIERSTNQCPHCDRLQEPPVNPDALLESREMGPARGPVQREIKQIAAPVPPPATDLVIAGARDDELARKRSPDDGILSAKELAAAFQLDFNPQTPATLPMPGERRGRGPARVFITLILLGAVGGGAVLFARPDYREKTTAWLNGTVSSIKNSASPEEKKPNPMPWDNSTAKTADPAPAPVEATDITARETPAPSPAVPETTQAPLPTEEIKSTVAAPPPAPVAETTADKTAAPANGDPIRVADASNDKTAAPAPPPIVDPAPIVEPKQTPPAVVEKPAEKPIAEKPLVEKPAEKVVLEKPVRTKETAEQIQAYERLQKDLESAIPAGIDSQISLGKRLYAGALDAERIGDFPLAIRCYKKIQDLDQAALPLKSSVLANYLQYAKDHLPPS